MPPRHSKKSLEGMKRADLQKLCKEYGVKANLKTEDLIDLLLDSQTPAAPRASVPRSIPQPTTRRSVSVKQPSQMESKQANSSRTSSMIVHDLEEEEENEESEATISDEPLVQRPPTPPLVPPPRTRKAKELQTRLGKGKPVIAGGSGPRAVTASSGSSKGRHSKSSKAMKPREPTIEEEPETLSTAKDTSQQVGEETNHHSHEVTASPAVNVVTQNNDVPVHSTGDEQAFVLQQVSSMKSEIASMRTQMSDISKAQKDILAEFSTLRELPAIIALLREDIRQLREGSHSSSRPSTPKPKSAQKPTSVLPIFKNPNLNLATAIQPNPSHTDKTESTLGKRRRDSTSSIIDGVIEECQRDTISQSKLATTVIRPDKKRTKMHPDSSSQASGDEGEPSDTKPSTFAVYRGSEEPDSAPPTNHLPEVFVVDSPPDSASNRPGLRPSSAVPTSSANASENQPFNFAFAPVSSIPRNSLFMANFPYPELPQSPSPAGSNVPAFSGRINDERTDIFKEFGLPSPVRPMRNYGALNNDERGINPAALQGSSSKRVSSNEVAASLGLTAHRAASDLATEAPIIRRTMYGTELDGDTRFGDFGVEGVASGSFWPAK